MTAKSYNFHLSLAGSEPFQLEGDSALLASKTPTTSYITEDQPIQIIVIAFKKKAVKKALKAKYGEHYKSIPWISSLDENLLNNTLLQSLSTWLILEIEKQEIPLNISWIHLEKALLEFFVINMDRRNSNRQDDKTIKRVWFTKLEQWIDANLTDTISMNDLEKVAGVSKRSIQKAFKEYKNSSPMQTISQLRLLKAREILLSTEKKVTVIDVAMTLGYLHPSRFAANYKKKFGEHPSDTLAMNSNFTNKKL